ncbi:DUF1365 domain-containing protein [Thalassotalea sp. G2M2-11]|uniref:DUF1365 domain-containing protein n=1 Tax=Thalassotalea sp. G2M2-11 TaxID=2787627 RepID=UPI0019D02529|nr:DUF1365 domain-containing protein [Thalassotalea sp. G2M2-11]
MKPNCTDNLELKSKIYRGSVFHKRFAPKVHQFSYQLYMLALEVDELEQSVKHCFPFGTKWYCPIRFVEKDYLKSEPGALKQRIVNKVKSLGGSTEIKSVVMLVQARCFGLYFSPANFYFCYDHTGKCQQMLAEVSNTPWNQRHYYLVNLTDSLVSEKAFHVSPFMDLAMNYHWHIVEPKEHAEQLRIDIENRKPTKDNPEGEKVFFAGIKLNKQAFTQDNLVKLWLAQPVMTVKIIGAIYWQALKLFLKKVPFVPYQKVNKQRTIAQKK